MFVCIVRSGAEGEAWSACVCVWEILGTLVYRSRCEGRVSENDPKLVENSAPAHIHIPIVSFHKALEIIRSPEDQRMNVLR